MGAQPSPGFLKPVVAPNSEDAFASEPFDGGVGGVELEVARRRRGHMLNEIAVGSRGTLVGTWVNAGLEYPGSGLIPERGTPFVVDAVEGDLGLPPAEAVAEMAAQLVSLPPLGLACPVGHFLGGGYPPESWRHRL